VATLAAGTQETPGCSGQVWMTGDRRSRTPGASTTLRSEPPPAQTRIILRGGPDIFGLIRAHAHL
jgi:hypothetical protein